MTLVKDAGSTPATSTINYITMALSETDIAYKKGYGEGFLIATDTFQEMLKRLAKDVERLEWILDQGSYWLSSREDIDKEMEESQQL